jgi:hypothetical protein
LDSRFLQLAIVAMCEFFFSAHPVFEAFFGDDANDPKFVDKYSHLIIALISRSDDAVSVASRLRVKRKPA